MLYSHAMPMVSLSNCPSYLLIFEYFGQWGMRIFLIPGDDVAERFIGKVWQVVGSLTI